MARTFQALAGGTEDGDLAFAVAHGRAFLLLDEPAAGAGDREREELVDLCAAYGRRVAAC